MIAYFNHEFTYLYNAKSLELAIYSLPSDPIIISSFHCAYMSIN